LRYYLYISDAKVDMLLPQVPGALQRKVSAKFGFDIKILSGSLETQRATLDNRVARMAAVEQYLVENAQIGSPARPASWIQGTVDAKFVDIGKGAILFLSGDSSSILALGGSDHHLVGATAPERVAIPMSFGPGLARQLTSLLEARPEWLMGMDENTARSTQPSGAQQGSEAWVSIVTWAFGHAESGVQKIEFLGKRLVTTKTSQDVAITLATPLYVSAADE